MTEIGPYDYFKWLCSCICNEKQKTKYKNLLNNLFCTPFICVLEMDSNRISDGMNLRYQFSRENRKSNEDITINSDYYPCNVLEVLVALSMRIETIMDNPEVGNRTGYWFWMMINNLNLSDMIDEWYDEKYVDNALSIFMERRYNRDGSCGGLVVLKNPRFDLRYVEIWDQINWYLSENYI